MPSSGAISALTQHGKGMKTGEVVQSHRQGESYRHATTIDMLPNDVLIEVFAFCQMSGNRYGISFRPSSEWHRLVHVCRRWRHIVFTSPGSLELTLLCTYGTPVRKNLRCWPPLPIIVDYFTSWDRRSPVAANYEDDVIAALENPDRVRGIKLAVTSSLLGMAAPVTQVPFPVLADLWLSPKDQNVPVLPGAFLGSSAPQLRGIYIEGISFPELPTLLSSATDLVSLRLENIPQSGYISPEAIVTGLAASTRLDSLCIWFKPQTSRLERGHSPPLTRTIFLSLVTFNFRGLSEYLEDLLALVDTPQLHHFKVTYFNQLDFQVPQLSQFIGRAENFELARFRHAHIRFNTSNVNMRLESEQGEHRIGRFTLRILSEGLDWQVSHLAQILDQSPALVSNVGHLSIDEDELQPGWQDDMDDAGWLELLFPFTAVEMLRGSEQLAGHIALALDNVSGEIVTEVLPALNTLMLDDQLVRSVEQFIAVRRFSGRPVTFIDTF
ncbi:hypothetical protein EDB89DRAFT_904755 [Lactarius sanguifluus]|nr:hypothetical protein EDB89DRAFT_904755 [Lactarius sanguifluus]